MLFYVSGLGVVVAVKLGRFLLVALIHGPLEMFSYGHKFSQAGGLSFYFLFLSIH